ncbi:carbamate kinase, partial [Bacteroides fragilis]|nr:carbamate kinase [Bacteroides fragilis]
NTYVEDSGRGWRWVIASPLPIEVVEAKSIANILGSGGIAIAAGGGGIPVVRNTYVEDSGRGWRWVIASPLPIEVVEAKSIANI